MKGGGVIAALAALIVVALAGGKSASAGTKNGAKNGRLPATGEVSGDSEAVMALQRELIALGFDLGKTGPNKDGVDGKVGSRSCAAALAASSRGRSDLHPDVLGWDCGTPLFGACALLPKSAPATFKRKCMQALNSKDADLMARTALEAETLGFASVGRELRALADDALHGELLGSSSFGRG